MPPPAPPLRTWRMKGEAKRRREKRRSRWRGGISLMGKKGCPGEVRLLIDTSRGAQPVADRLTAPPSATAGLHGGAVGVVVSLGTLECGGRCAQLSGSDRRGDRHAALKKKKRNTVMIT